METSLNISDIEKVKLTELRRVKRLATAILVLCFLVLILTKWAESRWPSLAYVAAFAEAATIGGIADWYAVVALFKRPLNLPIPHTAIIPNNQARIGDNLGRFIERNFLAKETVNERLSDIRFSQEIANWLSDPQKSEEFARFVTKLVPQMMEAVDQTGVRRFAADRIKTQLKKTKVAPMAAKLMDAFVKDGRDKDLLDDLIEIVRKFLNGDVAQETIRLKVQKELPSLLYVVQAEGPILRRIVAAADSLLTEVKEDENHPLREEFHDFLQNYVSQVKGSRRFAKRAEALKNELLARPEFADIAERFWMAFREFVEADIQKEDSTTVHRLSGLLVDVGQKLQKEEALKSEIDRELSRILAQVVEAQKSNVSGFISDQVKNWDFAQLVVLIEANIGKDLQYIRFNGMLIGGIAGVILHLILEAIG